jgi:hypothetical protein
MVPKQVTTKHALAQRLKGRGSRQATYRCQRYPRRSASLFMSLTSFADEVASAYAQVLGPGGDVKWWRKPA